MLLKYKYYCRYEQEMDHLIGKERSSLSTETPALAKCDGQYNADDKIPDDKFFKVGSIYEINHRNIPPDLPRFIPVQIKFVRVAMVSKKTEELVFVRIPSMVSILRHLNDGTVRGTSPDLDTEISMGLSMASELLFRQVPRQIYAERKHLLFFWLLVNSGSQPFAPRDSLSYSHHNEPFKYRGGGHEASSEEGEEAEEENSDEEADATAEGTNMNRKRKRYTSLLTSTRKNAKREWASIIIPEHVLKAHMQMRIKNHGAIDGIIKHIDGQLFPGGNERYRRRRNAEGAFEYWIEDANLINIRKKAGVTDRYWIPPPGWEPPDGIDIVLIDEGSFYEINIPPVLFFFVPVKIKLIRVAMVSKKTDKLVFVRFPSMKSLQRHLKNVTKDSCPDLDEELSMGLPMARQLFTREVPPKVYEERKHLMSWWLPENSASQPVIQGDEIPKFKIEEEGKYMVVDEEEGGGGDEESEEISDGAVNQEDEENTDEEADETMEDSISGDDSRD